ncbi:TetR/AcrR family transcriptional regulator [Mycolicibacterium cosmeticum]|uniref:TetR family transcriptional regulator n=1 Tax=Mycolicibacterium cosmeticum TaxID=258533 RepID=W9ARW3_MYCCO|nr:TetR/AcrR family transcriptional regulator [Mycolicibacterium cosmeticum]CDO05617.1 TetR family transcriptional regulator [Mycolicibacterium cosmeticum]
MSTGTSRPLRADAARNRRLLLDAARAAFEQQGVTASLDDVARAAGVGPGTLYRHFPTRDHLVLAVIDEGLSSIAALGRSLLDDADPVGALTRWLTAFIEQGSTFRGLAATLVAPADSGEESASVCLQSRLSGHALVRRAIDAGLLRDDIDAGDVIDMAGAIAWVGEQPERDAAQRDRLLRILVDGLRRPRQPAQTSST